MPALDYCKTEDRQIAIFPARTNASHAGRNQFATDTSALMIERIATAILVVLIWPAYAASQDIDTGVHDLYEVAPGIFAVEPKFAGAAAAVIVNESGVIIVDSHSTPASSATLIDAIGKLTDAPIRYVINTHWHVDHHSGNQAYTTDNHSNVDIIAHDHTREDIPILGRDQYEQTAPYRTMPRDRAAQQMDSGENEDGETLNKAQIRSIRKFHDAQEEFLQVAEEFEFTLPNVTISNSLTLHGEPHEVQVMHLHRAHTRGDLVVYVPEQKILIVGDILTKPILWSWSSYPKDYIRTLTALEKLDFDKVLIGHGGPVLEGKEYLRTAREFMQEIVAYATKSSTAGTDVERAVEGGASDPDIQAFRRRFVADNDQENVMFDQMVGWTIDRAYLEINENQAVD